MPPAAVGQFANPPLLPHAVEVTTPVLFHPEVSHVYVVRHWGSGLSPYSHTSPTDEHGSPIPGAAVPHPFAPPLDEETPVLVPLREDEALPAPAPLADDPCAVDPLELDEVASPELPGGRSQFKTQDVTSETPSTPERTRKRGDFKRDHPSRRVKRRHEFAPRAVQSDDQARRAGAAVASQRRVRSRVRTASDRSPLRGPRIARNAAIAR
jgi:hypothetical protein